MRSMGLRAKAARKYKATTNSNHTLSVAPNLLLQDFYATAPNQKWVSDITYIWTDEGWLYLAVALDLFARRRRLVNGGSHDDNARCRCQTHLKPNTLLAECPLKRSRITSQQASEFAGEQRISTLLGNLAFPRPTGASWVAMHMIKAIGYAAQHANSDLKPFEFEREEPGNHDVVIKVLYCGVCHSDIHQAKNEWSNTVYPCVPGHEAVGRVTQVGASVSRHQVGDMVGVGCMIDSCRQCAPCESLEENYCTGPNSWLATYNGPMIPAKKALNGLNSYGLDNTYGAFSNVLVVNEGFVLKIPDGLKPEIAAPILCAGVTTFSPMKRWGITTGHRVGIVGFGGLGHMAAKIAKALGAEVTVFTRSKEKLADAERLGVHAVHESSEPDMQALAAKFDFILSTVPEKHDINPFIALLKRDCTLVIVGALEELEPVNNQAVAFGRKSVAGSLIGSLAETQEILNFCAKHQIGPDIELIGIKQINEAFSKVESGDVRFRYVIDMASLDLAHQA